MMTCVGGGLQALPTRHVDIIPSETDHPWDLHIQHLRRQATALVRTDIDLTHGRRYHTTILDNQYYHHRQASTTSIASTLQPPHRQRSQPQHALHPNQLQRPPTFEHGAGPAAFTAGRPLLVSSGHV